MDIEIAYKHTSSAASFEMHLRKDPCGIICIFITYAAVFYADYVVCRYLCLQVYLLLLFSGFYVINDFILLLVRWIVLTVFDGRLLLNSNSDL